MWLFSAVSGEWESCTQGCRASALLILLHGKRSPQMKHQHRQNLLRSLSKSLAKIIFPESSILCLFPNSLRRAEASAGRGCQGACAGGLTPLPSGRCWVKPCQPAALLHIPSGSPPLCHQHSAALPVLKVFPRETLHLNSFGFLFFFPRVFRVGSLGEKIFKFVTQNLTLSLLSLPIPPLRCLA